MPLTHDNNQVFLPMGTTNVKNVPYVLDWPLDHGTCTGLQHDNIVHRIQRAFTFKMMYRNLGTSGGATNSLNRALIRSHQTD